MENRKKIQIVTIRMKEKIYSRCSHAVIIIGSSHQHQDSSLNFYPQQPPDGQLGMEEGTSVFNRPIGLLGPPPK